MISIAMATYNGAKYLREQIDSILAQTIQDFELIVCDDCSSDETWDILKQYSDADKRIKVFQNESNLGFKRNFEKAMLLCSGEYIALSDQDDIWLPDKVETIIQYFDTHSQVDALFTDATLIDSEGKPLEGTCTLWDYFFDEISRKRCEMGLMIEEFSSSTHATGATMAFRKSLTSRFPNRNNMWHDDMIARLAVSSHSLAYLPKCLTQYRIHSSQQIGISPCKSDNEHKRDYRQPEMPFSIADLFLTNEDDIKHIEFLQFRCRTKHQAFGWINAIVHLSSYKRFYNNHAFAFAMYDIRSSIKHTTERIERKVMPFFLRTKALVDKGKTT